MIAMSLAKRIRDFRYAKGWGPDELAGRAQISRTALYQIECGKTETPRAGTLSRIAQALGLPVDVLLGLDEPGYDFGDHGQKPWSSDRFRRGEPEAELSLLSAGRVSPSRNPVTGSSGGMAKAYTIDTDVEEKFRDLLDSPLAESIIRLIEETHRLLPYRAAHSAV
jgi:transcriptional regulator with XRE-family HTH domain